MNLSLEQHFSPNLDTVKRSLHNDNFDEDSNCYKFADWHLQ